MTVQFQKWPKISRWDSPVVITEKIDGSNAAVVIEALDEDQAFPADALAHVVHQWNRYAVYAQSRNRFLDLGSDNFGFAGWVDEWATDLVEILGPGRHYGEWWGSGIQRAYGLSKGERNFSLFDTGRWQDVLASHFDTSDVVGLRRTPIILCTDDFDPVQVTWALNTLNRAGSFAAHGFMKPEGIVIHFEHNKASFKAFCEGEKK